MFSRLAYPPGGGGTGAAGDMMASLVNAPTSLTNPSSGANTLTANAWNYVTATAACSAKMPAPAAKLVVGIRIVDSSTNLFTLQPNGAETIYFGNNSSRIMWSGETAFFASDGTNWFLLGGACRQMLCRMFLNTAQSPTFDTITVVNIDGTGKLDPTGLMANAANHSIDLQRAGTYDVTGIVSYTPTDSSVQAFCFLYDGATKLGSAGVVGIPATVAGPVLPTLGAVGDHIYLEAYWWKAGGSGTQALRADGASTSLYVREVAPW